MKANRHAALLSVAASFLAGSLSAHCAGPGRTPNAVAAEQCPPPPCASAAPRSASLAASATARIDAAKRAHALELTVFKSGNMALPEYLVGGGRVFRATRDSDVVGPDLVAAATEYVATVRLALELARARYPQVSSPAEVAWAEYNLAEAEYFLEEAKTRR